MHNLFPKPNGTKDPPRWVFAHEVNANPEGCVNRPFAYEHARSDDTAFSGRADPSAAAFERLLDACESSALKRGLKRLEAGVNLARHEVYQRLLARGFRTDIQGVAMHRPNEPGNCRPDVFVMDDWR